MKIFEIKTVQSSVIRTLFEALKDILDDVTLYIIPAGKTKDNNGDIREGGLIISEINKSENIVVHSHLLADKFEEFYCKKLTKIGINMTNIYKLLKILGNNDILTFNYDDSKMHKLTIIVENPEKNSITKYELSLIEIPSDRIYELPNNYSSIMLLPSNYFSRLCKDMNNIAKYVEIKMLSNKMILSCNGSFANQETLLSESNNEDSDTNCLWIQKRLNDGEIVQGEYELKNLTMFAKCTGVSQDIKIKMENDMPLAITYQIASLGEVVFYLSHRVRHREIDDSDSDSI